MIIEQHQLPCLSLSSYLVADEGTGRAVVIDPQRDISIYLESAREQGLSIEHVLLTHFHADYVSGHLELAAATGAEICFGEPAEADFPIRNLSDGERIDLGDVVIEAMSTPGHTPESFCYVAYEKGATSPEAVFTGDTLFVGDVGRPDLLGAIGFTAEQLGAQLYDSLEKLTALPDDTTVYPGHGAGSACGKQLGSEPFTSIGDQKASNYALQPMERDEFIAMVTEGQPAAPGYFLHDAITNRREHGVFDESRELEQISADDAAARRAAGAVIIDTRDPEQFALGHIEGAINVDLGGRFAEQAGAVVKGDDEIVVCGADDGGREAMIRLGRIGFDQVVASIADHDTVVDGGGALVARTARIEPEAVASLGDVQLVDVRNPGETNLGVMPDAVVVPLGALPARVDELDPARPTVVYCAGGARSSVAASWLRTQGFGDVRDVRGGYQAWSALTTGASA